MFIKCTGDIRKRFRELAYLGQLQKLGCPTLASAAAATRDDAELERMAVEYMNSRLTLPLETTADAIVSIRCSMGLAQN